MRETDHIGDKVPDMPPGFKLMGRTDSCPSWSR
jgi:GMP synthase-like glutamine amidotransferase